jgi:hypothetical protein
MRMSFVDNRDAGSIGMVLKAEEAYDSKTDIHFARVTAIDWPVEVLYKSDLSSAHAHFC